MFRFIHTADWQLGRAFDQFEPELAAQLREARLTVIERIAEAAREHGAAYVLVAGDVWDTASPSDRLLRQPMDLMAAAADLTWCLLPGNHDPCEPQGFWDRLRRQGVPDNVWLLTDSAPVMLSDGVSVLPAPWTSKAPGRDLTAGFSAIDTGPDALRIGLAHGGTSTFFDQSPQSAAIDADRANEAGLDYLALGDWHGLQQIDGRTWYSGTPEPDRFPNNKSGHVLAVTLERGASPVVTPVRTADYVWTRDRLDCRDGVDACAEADAIFDAHGSRRRRLCRLELHGELRLGERMRLFRHLETEAASLAHLRLKRDGLLCLADPDALDDIDREGVLRETAANLVACMEDEAALEADRAVARRALDYLAAFAGEGD
ncbi:MAG: metallophosphoesterase family protein [Oceanicaulis sp.]